MKISKRILSVFLALVMLASVCAISVSASRDNYPAYDANKPSFIIGTVKCTAAGIVTVPVSVAGNTGFWGGNVQISYPAELTYNNIEKVNTKIGSCLATADKNVVTVLFEASSETDNIKDIGNVFNLKFDVANFAVGAKYAIDFVDGDRCSLTDVDGTDLTQKFTFKAGAIECVSAAVVTTTVKPTTKKPTTTACKHAKTKVANKKSATYFAKGYSGDTVCASCKKVIKKGKSVAKKVLKAPKVKLTAAKKSFKVKYTKLSGAAGFQVKYRVKGAKKWTTKNFDTKKTKTVTIKKLKKGKKYQIQVAAYAKSGKKRAVGKFTSTKTIKVK